ncbi:unnamed protein product [Prunus armeniaca]|uniref:Cullin N-terminal domain-containing protein n=1 Tax=Prunus armeniaca TaxID=36596 RepID=A0A6J5VUI4_PRUAR|nr:unnamed protein product [Prunus armeniaca]
MLMDGSCIEDLQRMYTLFSRVNALESLRQALSSYIWRTGQEIITCESEDEEMVASPSKFKLSLDTIWEESFMKNLDFGKTIKNAFEHLQAKRLDVADVCYGGESSFNQATESSSERSQVCQILGGIGGIRLD